MRVYIKKWVQDIPGNPEQIWGFFSRPENLQKITPAEMNFQIQTDLQGKDMYEGMMIVYKVSPFKGVPMTWATEITHIKPGIHFIDEQRIGPYAMWHHEHWFEPIEGGVRMTDLLHYAVAMGPIGQFANALIVNKKVDCIFTCRTKVIEKLIGEGTFL